MGIIQNKAIFFDRDGVINYRPVGDYVKSPDEFSFCPDLFKFLKFIKEKNYLAIIITNQQGVSKGLMTNEQLSKVHNYMQSELNQKISFNFDDIYSCTDLATNKSSKRKPNPTMILEAIEKYNIDKNQSWIIGDSITDIMAGEKAEIGTIFLGNSLQNPFINPNFKFTNLYQIIENFSKIENFELPFLKYDLDIF